MVGERMKVGDHVQGEIITRKEEEKKDDSKDES